MLTTLMPRLRDRTPVVKEGPVIEYHGAAVPSAPRDRKSPSGAAGSALRQSPSSSNVVMTCSVVAMVGGGEKQGAQLGSICRPVQPTDGETSNPVPDFDIT